MFPKMHTQNTRRIKVYSYFTPKSTLSQKKHGSSRCCTKTHLSHRIDSDSYEREGKDFYPRPGQLSFVDIADGSMTGYFHNLYQEQTEHHHEDRYKTLDHRHERYGGRETDGLLRSQRHYD